MLLENAGYQVLGGCNMEIKKLTDLFCVMAKDNGWEFSLKGRDLTPEEMFAFNGMLPALAKRADQLSLLCLGYGVGVSFDESDSSILGYQMKLNEDSPDVVRLACLYDVLLELVNHSTSSKVAVDELLYE